MLLNRQNAAAATFRGVWEAAAAEGIRLGKGDTLEERSQVADRREALCGICHTSIDRVPTGF
jgi:hypothetical protein